MLVMISGLLIWKSNIFLRATGYELIGDFQSIGGLLDNAEVRYRGYKIGNVAKIVPGPKSVQVHFFVAPGSEIPKSSKLKIIFDGLVGEKYISIVPDGSDSEMAKEGDILHGYATSGLADFVDVGTQNLQHTKEIVASLEKILTSKDVNDAIRNTLLRIEDIANNLNALTTALSSNDIKDIVANLRSVSASLEKTSTVLLADGNFAGNIKQASSDLALMSQNLKGISETINTQITPESFQKINNTISNIEAITGEVRTMMVNPDGSTKNVLSKPKTLLGTLGALKVQPTAGLNYSLLDKQTYYDAGADFKVYDSFFRFGVTDRGGSSQLAHIQQGTDWGTNVSSRIGLVYSKPGVGLDYHLSKRTSLSLDVYDLNKVQAELTGRTPILDSPIDMVLNLRKDPNTESGAFNNVSLGVSYQPK